MPPRIPPDKRRKIDGMLRAGRTQTEIAAALGVDRHSVARHSVARVAARRQVPERPGAAANEQGEAWALTPAEVAGLKYLLAGASCKAVCAQCQREVYCNPFEANGTCNWCGAKWGQQARV